MARALTAPSPAKLNLTLRVLGRRDDGRHNIDSVMVLTDFADRVTVSPRADGELRRGWTHPQVRDEDDLCMRAARLLRRESGVADGATIAVRKNIPPGGGLGGGSSNAATTLMLLNQLWRTGLRRRRLQTLAMLLGADAPFFVYGRTARARGAGEKLSAARAAWIEKRRHFLIVTPAAMSPTAEVYRRYDELQSLQSSEAAAADGGNDLSAAAMDLFPRIAAAAESLRRAAGEARLSGAGASVFAAFESRAAAAAAKRKLPPPLSSRAVVAALLPRHPLADSPPT